MNDDINRLHEVLGMALRMHELGARRSGRTTRMIDQVRDGEIVACLNSQHARHIQRSLDEKGLRSVKVVTCEPRAGALVSSTAGYRGRVHLDHCWVHEFYSAAIIDATRDIEGAVAIRDEFSGRDAAPTGNPMQDAIDKARGGPAPTTKRGYA